MNLILFIKDDVLLVVDQANLALGAIRQVNWKDDIELDAFFKSLPTNSKLKLVFDFIDENMQYQWVPKLLPWEKPALEKRLLAKARSNGGVFIRCQWLPIFEHNGSRHEQMVLIASVSHSPALEQFLAAIKTYQLSVTHLYSYAFLIANLFFKRLAPKLKLNSKQLKLPFLVVFRERHNRFRQLFFLQGVLRISRSVELYQSVVSEQKIHHQLSRETEIAIKYLYNQKILDLGTPVGFVYLDHMEEEIADLVALYRQNVVGANWDDSQWFAKESGLNNLLKRNKVDEKHSVILALSELMAKSPPPVFYQWDYAQKHRFFNELSLSLKFLWMAAAIGGSAFLIQQAVQTYLLLEKQALLTNQTQLYLLEKKRLQDSIRLSYDAEDVKATVEFSEAIMQSQAKRGLDLVALSEIVAQHSHILLESLDWKKGVKLDGDHLSVDIKGWVFPFDTTFQPPVQWVDEFVLGLQVLPNVMQVQLIKEPLDRNLQKSLEIEGETIEVVKALPFTVSLQFGSVSDKKKDDQ